MEVIGDVDENTFSGFMGAKPKHSKENGRRTSLVVQGLRIHLPMQGTWVQYLVGELSQTVQPHLPPPPKKSDDKWYISK